MKTGKDFDNEWLAFIRDQDEKAYYALYQHYHDYLSYVGLKRGATAAKVKDCINDLFLYVYEHREQLQHIQSHHNYLVTSFLRSLFRKEHFSAGESEDLERLPEEPAFPSAETEAIRKDGENYVRDTLKHYVDQLPARQSRIIYQKFYLGLSYEEISLSNGITIKTAYNTIYNAVQKLKTLIGKEKLATLSITLTLLTLLFLFFFKN
ncbi:RNA polymerase sigma factor, sigma-70 family [bacterium A37T11]|nr:RNA polymerase sigma factor, sigma-70 family [bacterium A37T11]